MHPVADATRTVAHESFGMIRDAIDGMADEALAWQPDASANSMTVLPVHSISATLFWLRAGAGEDVSLTQYRAEERTPAFASSGKAAAQLHSEIDACLATIDTVLGSVDEASLSRLREWPEDPAMAKTGATCLVHAIGHLREHVGQVQLTRDLWIAQHGSK